MHTLIQSKVFQIFAVAIFLVVASTAGMFAYGYRAATQQLTEIERQHAAAIAQADATIARLTAQIQTLHASTTDLLSQLHEESDRNAQYEKQLKNLASTVTYLEKVSKTDRELLQKYSNVYFLSENFVPSSLVAIDAKYLYRPESNVQIHSAIKPELERMIHNATADAAPLLVLSGYRSFGAQEALKSSYKITYGAGTANQFSADQGYSEHQLGSTVDFTTPQGGEMLSAFEKSPGFTWLTQHAHEYGFILSYPKGNGFFQYEPWHWRFVGVELATRLKNEGKYFYDLDQREINSYLANIFR